MKPVTIVLTALLLVSMSLPEAMASNRSWQVRDSFRKRTPCPATGERNGRCPGWEIDHIQPLCSGGRDDLSNLQWLTVEEHKIKTRSDLLACRRKQPAPLHD
jgi:hypothetical protein